MNLNVARKGDLCTGHGCFPPRPAIEGSPDVFVNGRPMHRLGDAFAVHCCGKSCHGGSTIEGARTVFCNGIPVAMITNKVSCGSAIMTGSENVFVKKD